MGYSFFFIKESRKTLSTQKKKDKRIKDLLTKYLFWGERRSWHPLMKIEKLTKSMHRKIKGIHLLQNPIFSITILKKLIPHDHRLLTCKVSYPQLRSFLIFYWSGHGCF